MTRLTNWTRESRTPTLAYRNTETDARAVLHRAPGSYVHKWQAAILVESYPVWSRGFATKDATSRRVPTASKFNGGSSAGSVATKAARRSCTVLSADFRPCEYKTTNH